MQQNFSKAVLFMLIAATFSGGLAGVAKWGGTALSPECLLAFARLFILFGLIPMFLGKQLKNLQTNYLLFHLFRALCATFALYLYFMSLTRLSIVDVVVLYNSMPIFAAIIASFWLKERLSLVNWLGVVVAFAGVICVVQPGTNVFNYVSLYTVLGGALLAVSEVTNRKLSLLGEPVNRIVFWFLILSPIISIVPWAGTGFDLPEAHRGKVGFDHYAIIFLAIGLVTWAFQSFRTKALALASASRIIPFGYFSIFVAALVGWMVWKQVPSAMSIIGFIFILGGAILLTPRSSKQVEGQV